MLSNVNPNEGEMVRVSGTIVGQYTNWQLKSGADVFAQGPTQGQNFSFTFTPRVNYNYYSLEIYRDGSLQDTWLFGLHSWPNTPTPTLTPTPTYTPMPTATPTPSITWSGSMSKWGVVLDDEGKPRILPWGEAVVWRGKKVHLAFISQRGAVSREGVQVANVPTPTATPGGWADGDNEVYVISPDGQAWVEVPPGSDEFVMAGQLYMAGGVLLADNATIVGLADDPVAVVLLAAATGYAVYGVYRQYADPEYALYGQSQVFDFTRSAYLDGVPSINPQTVYVLDDNAELALARFEWVNRPSDLDFDYTWVWLAEVSQNPQPPAGLLGTLFVVTAVGTSLQEKGYYLSTGQPAVPVGTIDAALPDQIGTAVGPRYRDRGAVPEWTGVDVGPHEVDTLGRSPEEIATRKSQRAPSWHEAIKWVVDNLAKGKPPCDWMGYRQISDTCYCACYLCTVVSLIQGISDIHGVMLIANLVENTAIPVGSDRIPKGWAPGDTTLRPKMSAVKDPKIQRNPDGTPVLDPDGKPITHEGAKTVNQSDPNDPHFQRCNELFGGGFGPPPAPARDTMGWEVIDQP